MSACGTARVSTLSVSALRLLIVPCNCRGWSWLYAPDPAMEHACVAKASDPSPEGICSLIEQCLDDGGGGYH